MHVKLTDAEKFGRNSPSHVPTVEIFVFKVSCTKLVRFQVIGLIWKPHQSVRVSSLTLMSIATSVDLGIHVTYDGPSGLVYLESAFVCEGRLFRTNGRPPVLFFSPSRDITSTFGLCPRELQGQE